MDDTEESTLCFCGRAKGTSKAQLSDRKATYFCDVCAPVFLLGQHFSKEKYPLKRLTHEKIEDVKWET